MKRMLTWVTVAGMGWTGCRPAAKSPAEPPPRMEIRKVTNNSVEFFPTADQLPYCLLFTRSAQGVTRQLTMSKSNLSVPCKVNEPVMGLRFRIPVDEGRVRTYAFFSDQRLHAERVAEQLTDIDAATNFNAMDLRLPGRVVVDVSDFSPSDEVSVVTGEVVAPGSGDAGVVPPSGLGGDAGPPRG